MKTQWISYVLTFLAGCVVACWAEMGNITANAQATRGDAEVERNASGNEPFFMLNALWFKEDGGAEKYRAYMTAAGPFVARHGGKAGRAYVPEANLIGKFDADLVFFVEWPNQKAFTEFIRDPGYQAVSHLRGEAIRDSLLIRCRGMEDRRTLWLEWSSSWCASISPGDA